VNDREASDASGTQRVRLDKWLWAARFYKTRSMATAAISGGHVEVNQGRAKASRSVAIGDCIEIVKGEVRVAVTVTALAERRRSAPEAALLYEETAASRARREAARERRRDAPAAPLAVSGGRPTKRDRRRLDRLTGRR